MVTWSMTTLPPLVDITVAHTLAQSGLRITLRSVSEPVPVQLTPPSISALVIVRSRASDEYQPSEIGKVLVTRAGFAPVVLASGHREWLAAVARACRAAGDTDLGGLRAWSPLPPQDTQARPTEAATRGLGSIRLSALRNVRSRRPRSARPRYRRPYPRRDRR